MSSGDAKSGPWLAPKLSGYLSFAMIGLILGCVVHVGWVVYLGGRVEFYGYDHKNLPIMLVWGYQVRMLLGIGLCVPMLMAVTAMLAGGRQAGEGMNRLTTAMILALLGILTVLVTAVFTLSMLLQWWEPFLK